MIVNPLKEWFSLTLNFDLVFFSPCQEDVVMGTLTVRENLSFSAALRLSSSVPQSEKEARVNHLIEELGLAKVADSKVYIKTRPTRLSPSRGESQQVD